MAIDLTKLSPKELETLINSASTQMKAARAAHVHSVKQKIEAILSESGLALDEVFSLGGKKHVIKSTKGSTVAAKYRDPADPSQTWSGRGRKPAWFIKALRRRGITAEHLLIDGAAKEAPKGKRAAATKKVGKRVVKRVARKATKKA